jgi:hypothetical protein
MNAHGGGEIKEKYLRKAIAEYEYSPEPHYGKAKMSALAATEGTLDFDYDQAESDVEVAPDGAWVLARVWIPREWVE